MNRNKMVLLNGIIVATTSIITAVLGMVEVSLFLEYYGSEINGLIQTGHQVLNYVVLIEAGLSAAFLYKMYKPIADRDNTLLSEYYNGFKKSMKKVVNIMLAVAVVLSALYPLVLKTNSVSYLDMLTIFVLLSFKVILPYKVTIVPKYMIIAKEQKYKAELITGICRAVTYLVEIAVIAFGIHFQWNISVQILLFIGVVISLLNGLWFQVIMNSLYGSTLDKNAVPNIAPNKMSKDLLVHNISRMVFSSTDNIIISTMGTLEAVTVYSSYNMVIGQVVELAQKFMDGTTATLGIKIAHGDKNAYDIFREMLSGSYWLGGIIASVFICMMNDFVVLWIGQQYCINHLNLILFSMVLYCGVILPCIQVARNACGLYKESRNFTAAQAAANLLITIVLVPKLGITGALIGTVSARILITVPCNYYLVCKTAFPESTTRWLELTAGYVLVIAVGYLTRGIVMPLNGLVANKVVCFLLKTFLASVISAAVYTGYYLLMGSGFVHFMKRIKYMLKRH